MAQVIPPVYLGPSGGAFTAPVALNIESVVCSWDQAAGSGIDLRYDGSNGASLLKVAPTGAAGSAALQVNAQIPVAAGQVLYNNGDALLVIFG